MPCSYRALAHRLRVGALELIEEPVDDAALADLVLQRLADDAAGQLGRQTPDLGTELGERGLAVRLDLGVRGLDEAAGLGLRLLAELRLDLRGLLTSLLACHQDGSLDDAAADVLPEVRGAYSLVFMDETTLYAARDPQGIRPFVLGRLGENSGSGGWVVASETAALDIVGAKVVREIEPGELLVIDVDGVRSTRFAPAKRKGCLFEYVYLARPDTTINGRNTV